MHWLCLLILTKLQLIYFPSNDEEQFDKEVKFLQTLQMKSEVVHSSWLLVGSSLKIGCDYASSGSRISIQAGFLLVPASRLVVTMPPPARESAFKLASCWFQPQDWL